MVQRSDARPLEPGVVVGEAYRIVRPTADAGLGLIYEVEEIATGARRSLELVRGTIAADPEVAARVDREARLAAQIESPHVCRARATGFDRETGAIYVVTDLLDGSTLAGVIAHAGGFPWSAALSVLEQVADALGAAHSRGIVHRDLRPATIFAGRAGAGGPPLFVSVLDFGLTKALAASRDLASPAWKAPEQLTPGSNVTSAVDVWSYGLLAFTLLTGKHYVPSANLEAALPSAVVREVLVEDLAPASRRAARLGVGDRLPPRFDEWLARCVARDPLARFSDIRFAYQELASLRHRPSPSRQAFVEDELTLPATPSARRGPQAPPPTHPPTSLSTSQSPPPGSARWTGALIMGLAALVGALTALAILAWVRKPQAAAAAATLPASPSGAPSLRLHGSNTIGAELAPALAESFLRRRTGLETVVRRRTGPDEMRVEARDGARTVEVIEIAAHGSTTAFEDLGAGRCDIGMASRRIHDDENARLSALGDLTSAATEHVIALDGIAVIVNPVNPVSSLTRRQIGDVFSGKLRRWSDVYWKADPIVVHARDDNSGTYDTFRHLALEGRPLAPEARRHESSEELSDAVAADPDAIGFIGLPYVRSAKAVMVQEEGSVPLLPSPLTVATEDYPLTRRLYLYAPLTASVEARDFIDFAQSEEGQKVVESAGFVDLRPECDPSASHCTSCSTEYRDVVAGACRLSLDFRFVRGGSQLDTRGLRDLQRLVGVMSRPENARRAVVLLGFADATGARADNMALSVQRASIVATQLRARGLHVGVERGFGADMPISDNSTDEGRERNRRVEVWLR